MESTIQDQYKVLSQIGQGSFGSVYKAIERSTGKKVAIKVVKVARNNHRNLTLVLREIQIMKQLRKCCFVT